MAIQKGKDLLLKVSDGAGGFVTVAGLRSRSLSFNAEPVDVTHSESAGRWRELLAGAGVKKASVAGAGVFRDEASDGLVFDGAIAEFQIVIPDFGAVQGPFQVTGLEFRGEHAGEVAYDLALESAGALSFAAA
ncbi:phage major tail protein, TP901-1 family [Hansschlegelia beijingensis]|uniref:TP901-1 family phage major tail protein n=1 Tax=Hansschlegelia beijingensis TaxID=1133344 RepID=A0A7W6D0R1_9HYPH|nr:phage major tail protein, TP901-1 family [Hansschlegelia beijingensis]MBB3971937.1 TP901-1 family phage major tail protein [Hansschlegelia beijingensis]